MSRYFKKFKSGFSLVELLVSLGIITVILSVVVLNQSTYTDTASISNLAEEISISLSQAQAYGIGVKERTPGSSDFSASYGMAFSLLNDGANKAYLFFTDRDSDRVYDGDWTCPTGGSSECVERIDIAFSNYIDSICALRINQDDECASPKRVDVNFVRPDTGAQITFFNSGGQVYSPSGAKGARIVLKTPKGNSRSVLVYNNGQISVDGDYLYQYPSPYSYEYQYPAPYAYQYQYPTPPPLQVIVTYSGAANGTHNLTTSGPLNLTAPGSYIISFNTGATVRIRGVAGGGGGSGGATIGDSTCGGGGGGGGSVNSSGVQVSVSNGANYSASVGAGGAGGNNGGNGGTTSFGSSLSLSGGSGGTQAPGNGNGGGGSGGSGASPGGASGGSGRCDNGGGGGTGQNGTTGGGGGGGGKGENDTNPGTAGNGGNGANQNGGAPGVSASGGSGSPTSGQGGYGPAGGGGGGGLFLGGGYRGGGGGGGYGGGGGGGQGVLTITLE